MTENMNETVEASNKGTREEREEKQLKYLQDLVDQYRFLDLKKIDQFIMFDHQTFETQKDIVVSSVLTPLQVPKENIYKLEFVYKQYRFIEGHLYTFISKYEKACSNDKAVWLIHRYVDYLLSGTLPTIKKKDWYTPAVEDAQLWMDWIGSMYGLFGGTEETYVEKKRKLADLYEEVEKERMEHMHAKLLQHDYFVQVTKEEDKAEYEFLDPKINGKGILCLEKHKLNNYRFVFHDGTYAKTMNVMPEWFRNIEN